MIPENKVVKYLNIGLYAIVILSLFTYYNYWDMLFWRPMGIHFMRQTDSLSFIAFYVKTNAPLFEPGLLTLYSEDGKTASEFPIFYYLISFVWKSFGRQEFLLRLFNLSVITVGFYYLFLTSQRFLANRLLALLIIVFVFASPTLIYYANNFLPDATALGFTLIGIDFFVRYHQGKHHKRTAIIAMFWFLLASLMKLSYAIYPFACFGTVMLYEVIDNKRLDLGFKRHIGLFVSFAVLFVLLLVWAVYVTSYNQLHHGYFLSNIRPFWILNEHDTDLVWRHIFGYWWGWHYPPWSMILFALFALFLFFQFNKYDLIDRVFIAMLVLGMVAYFILFFAQFTNHDYYILTFIPALALLVLLSSRQLLKAWPSRWILYALIVCFGVSGIQHTLYSKDKVRWRYWNTMQNEIDEFALVGTKLNGADKQLDEVGVPQDARIICLRDPGYSGCTYYTNRFGWLLSDTTDEQIDRISAFQSEGAGYFILTDTTYLQNERLKNILHDKIYNNEKYSVYKLH